MIVYEDETLYSIVTRYHILAGHSCESITNDKLFGKARKQIHAYLPSGIEQIASALQLDPERLLIEHTLFKLYEPFLSVKDRHKLRLTMMNAMACCPANIVNSRAHVHTAYSRNFCPQCCAQDIFDFGVAFWHLAHQIPGVSACYRHHTQLEKVQILTYRQAHQYILPREVKHCTKASATAKAFAKFCQQCLDLLMTTEQLFTPHIAYAQGLSNQHFLAEGHRIRQRQLCRQLKDRWGDDYKALTATVKLNALANVLRSDGKCSTHPFKHLALGFVLFESAEAYVFAGILPRQNIDTMPQNDIVHGTDNNLKRQQSIIEQLYNGNSVNLVAQRLHCARIMVKRVGKNSGCLAYTALERAVWRKAVKGHHRADIACKLDISIGYVEQVISYFAGLSHWRQVIRWREKQQKHQADLIDYLRDNPCHNRQAIKRNCARAFYWLYLNDKPWLEQKLPRSEQPRPHTKVDWQTRDIKLRRTVKTLLLAKPSLNSRAAIDRLLGNHGWVTRKRHLLPLTMAVIEKHIQRGHQNKSQDIINQTKFKRTG